MNTYGIFTNSLRKTLTLQAMVISYYVTQYSNTWYKKTERKRIGNDTMQRLVTIYLDNTAYKSELRTGYAKHHKLIEEHLQQYLEDGWTISSVAGFGGNSNVLHVRGWVIVLLEKK